MENYSKKRKKIENLNHYTRKTRIIWRERFNNVSIDIHTNMCNFFIFFILTKVSNISNYTEKYTYISMCIGKYIPNFVIIFKLAILCFFFFQRKILRLYNYENQRTILADMRRNAYTVHCILFTVRAVLFDDGGD